MAESHFKVTQLVKILAAVLFLTVLALFTAASIRTLSLDVNAGLQLARWQKTNNISLVINQQQREELFARFKGNFKSRFSQEVHPSV